MRTGPELMEDVGRRVAELRRARALTQQALAERLDVSPQYVRRVEGGRANLSLESLAKLAAALDVDARELLRIPKSRERPGPGRPPRGRG